MRALTIGRIQGIAIRVHPTIAIVLLWVLLDWGRLSGGGGARLFGLLFMLLVFACVLLHELGHAVMAMHYGVHVHDITLSVIGGVARMGHVPLRSQSEMAIAVAGPVVNVAVAAALTPLLALAGVLGGYAGPGGVALALLEPSLVGLLGGLIAANLMLTVFNLLPAFPMDGGRILRASLSSMIGRDVGTRIAVRVGQGFAALLALAGVFWLHSYALPLVAVFIAVAAQAEWRAVRIESALRRMRVGQFALWDMGGVSPAQPLSYALRGGPRDLAVIEDGRVVGMLWRNRLLNELGRGAGGVAVREVMDREFVAVDVDDSVYDVHQYMNGSGRWAVPVVEGGLYRGVFTIDRLAHIYRQVTPHPIPGLDPGSLLATLDGWWRAAVR
ncbi:MAG: site-2 protease family protein [Thermomicrobiales bacterium]|nr:site-2 protease family protein [Thermomicrobiales bacterium]